ncbi:MAG: hypothetical protein ACOCWJ_03890 [Verrucomicrobiota bacterium]
MDTTLTFIESKIRQLLEGKPYLVRVSPSAEDPSLLCVRVFGVTKADMDNLKEQIFDLSDTLFPKEEKTLLPMLKTPKVTREHYPEIYLELSSRQWIDGRAAHRLADRYVSTRQPHGGSSCASSLPI